MADIQTQSEMMQTAMMKFSSKVAVANKLPSTLPKEFAYFFVLFKNGLDLAENVFTVYMFSDKFNFGTVFLTFIIVGLVKYFLEEMHHKMEHFTFRKFLTVLRIASEVIEGLFYIYYCEQTQDSIIFYSIFMSVQSSPLIWNLFTSDESDVDDKTWTEIFAVGFYSAIFFNSLSVWLAFTSDGSPFQTVGFQLFLTLYTCLLAAGFDLASCTIEMKQEAEDEKHAQEEQERIAAEAADPALLEDRVKAEQADVEAQATMSPAMLAIKEQLHADREEKYNRDKRNTAIFYYWLAIMVNAVYFSIVSFIYIVPYYRDGPETEYDYHICLLFLVCGGIFFGCLALISCMLCCLYSLLGPDFLTELKNAQDDYTPEEKAIMRAAQV